VKPLLTLLLTLVNRALSEEYERSAEEKKRQADDQQREKKLWSREWLLLQRDMGASLGRDSPIFESYS
jgi:hypothetical protein